MLLESLSLKEDTRKIEIKEEFKYQPASKALQPYVCLSPLPSASRRVIGHKCSKCSQTFKWKESLYRHLEEECSGRPSLARDSDKARAPPSASSKGRHQCPTCGKTYKSRGFFDAHVRKVCGRANEAIRAIKSTTWDIKSDHKCAICSRIFTSKRYLYQHIYRVHVEHGYFCEHCDYASKDKYKMARHMSGKHFYLDSLPKCHDCKKTFKSVDSLSQHRKFGHCGVSKKLFFCDHCANCYRDKLHLARHIKIQHDGTKRAAWKKRGGLHSCEVCLRAYKRVTDLRYHLQFNCGKPFKFNCDHCGYFCKSKCHVMQHIISKHGYLNGLTAGRSVCRLCGKTYKWKKALQNHLKYECGKDPSFFCDRCSYSAKHKSHVIRHIGAKHCQA
ncbi:telomere zinc finger-associated protein-like [Phymastichus coffea]|uniref:telomere zinc finger-associated protein-like n=1 Tax=Phymastichus coffea TaxID=108790 RepID=UPI00273C55C1|nr:telomere zinc finger-associated protein-like [Phymastichus coffea]